MKGKRVDLGGRRIIEQKKTRKIREKHNTHRTSRETRANSDTETQLANRMSEVKRRNGDLPGSQRLNNKNNDKRYYKTE